MRTAYHNKLFLDKGEFHMFENHFRDTWAYQEIGREFFEKGELLRSREAIVDLIQARFPSLTAIAQQPVEAISDPAHLKALLGLLPLHRTGSYTVAYRTYDR